MGMLFASGYFVFTKYLGIYKISWHMWVNVSVLHKGPLDSEVVGRTKGMPLYSVFFGSNSLLLVSHGC